jgi:translation initiation factor eIF-2B subunit epsilon
MAKKKSTSGSGADVDITSTKREQPLQAVLLADSFSNTFRPLSLDRPKVLCPLNNVIMMDYAIDFLARVGVEELFVVCVSDQVQAHIVAKHQQQRGTTASTSMQVTVIKDTSLANAGDALRELDRRDLVQSDPFILMFADTVTNVSSSMPAALAKHKERHKKDRSSMMTILFKPVGGSGSGSAHIVCECDDPTSSSYSDYSSIRSNTQDLVVGIDASRQGDNRIVVYDDKCTESSIAIPCSFFASHSQIDLHYNDWMDAGIYLCSPDVLARFTDEFDYNDIARKFVANSVAEEEEGLQNKIHAHVLQPHEYAARVTDFATYAAISRDLLQRWCYPVVPDNLPRGYEKHYRYALQRHYIYHEQKCGSGSGGNNSNKTRVGRSSVIHGPGMIGSNCVVGEECLIERCVIGNNCHIGFNVTLQGSHVWDGARIEDGATVVQSVLAQGSVVRAGAVVSRGCVIGAGCVVGKSVVLPAGIRLTLAKEKDDGWGDGWDDDESQEGDDDDEDSEDQKSSPTSDLEGAPDKTVVGPDGKGRVWMPVVDDEDEDLYGMSSQEVMKAQSIGFDPTSLFLKRQQMHQEADDGFSDDDDAIDSNNPLHDLDEYADDDAVEFGTSPVPPSSTSAAAAQMVIGRQQGVDVVAELRDICLDYEATSPIENLAIELNSYKFSQNATYSDCVMAAILAILDKMKITHETNDRKLVADFKSFLEHWSPLLQKMGIGVEEEKAMVVALEKAALEDNEMGKVLSSGMSFRLLLQTLHDEEIASEEAVLAWAEERKTETTDSDDSPRTRLFQTKHVQDFLEWLAEEESEEGSDDDESEAASEG